MVQNLGNLCGGNQDSRIIVTYAGRRKYFYDIMISIIGAGFWPGSIVVSGDGDVAEFDHMQQPRVYLSKNIHAREV